MAWSAKLQSGSGGVAGYNEFEMVYDAASQTAYKLKYGFNLGNQSPDVLYHTPDNGSPVPVRSKGNNRLIFLTFDIPPQADWDTIASKTAAIARLVDGPYSQAVRAQTRGDVEKVRVAIKPDGATYSTYFYVLTGFMDTAQAFSDPVAIINTMGRSITLALTCEPFGCGDTFTLSNSLVSSPHMIVDTDGDGLADGLVLNGTPATVDIWTANYLTGGKSQRIITNAAGGEGISTANVTASTSSTAVAYAWVSHSSGDAVTVRLTDGSGNIIQTKDLLHSDSTGVSDKSTKGPGGALWHRVVVTGSNTTAANFRLDVVRRSAIATQATNFLVDNLYMAVGATTAPPAFSSAKTLTNNGINHLDFWGVPGDVPALVRYALSGITNKSLVFGKKTDGTQLATRVRYIIQNTYFANGSTWATTSNYTRASADASVSDPYTATDSGDDGAATAKAIGETIWKVYAVARASALDNGLYAQWSADLVTYNDTGAVTPTTVNTWELWDLGILNPVGLVVKSDQLNSASYSTFGIRLVSVIPSSGTVDIDYLLLVPISEEYMIVENTPDTIMGDLRAVFNRKAATTPAYSSTWRGSMWQIASGPQMTRLVYHDYKTSFTANAVTAGDTMTITATIIPRTSHLLGVS